jgi:hypothetical protein
MRTTHSTGSQTALLRSFPSIRWFVAAVFALSLAISHPAFAQTGTATTLSVTNGSSEVTSVASGTVVTLTATVLAGSAPVTPGQVKFCDAAATYCEDFHIIGTAQLTSSGTAVFKFRPTVGNHSYKAVFVGTKTNAKSSSAASSLSVTGPPPTTTLLSATGSSSSPTLSATVIDAVSSQGPTGTVSFLDTSNSNTLLGTATLGAATSGFSILNSAGIGSAQNPQSFAIADFNGDGIPDIAVGGGGAMNIFLGNGNGTFTQSPASTPLSGGSGGAEQITTGDFNGDGITDLAVTVYPGNGITNILILLGKGDGTFTVASTIDAPVGTAFETVVTGDFNNDGILDLAIQSCTDCAVVGPIIVELGNGDGTFIAVSSEMTVYSKGLAAGDFNGDGILDLAYLGGESLTLNILLGNGDGTFTATTPMRLNNIDALSVQVADFNGDGIPDLAINSDIGIVIFLGTGHGDFNQTTPALIQSVQYVNIVVGDFNGDGIPDLAGETGGEGPPYETNVYLGKGDGTFSTVNDASWLGNSVYLQLAAADFNADGISDLAAINFDNVPSTEISIGLTSFEQATASTSVSFASGTHILEANYPGDTNLAPSISGSIMFGAQTTLVLNAGPSNDMLGEPAAITATLSGYSGSTNGEKVTFLDGGQVLGTGTLTAGMATLFISTLPVGTHILTASYPGDSYNFGATSNTVSFSVAGTPPALTSPAPGSHLSGSTATFTWSPGSGVTNYQLCVGTNWPGGCNIYASPISPATSAIATNLPTDGVTLYVTLRYEINSTWLSTNYTYTAAGQTAPPVLTSPGPGSVLPGSTATFQWTPGSGVTAYSLSIGTYGPGYFNLGGSPQLSSSTTSYTMTNIPTDGKPVYITLRYQINGVWQTTDYTYTAAPLSNPPVMLSPTPGSVLPGSSVTFTWQPSSAVTAYTLSAGTYGPGYFNLGGSPQLSGSTTSYTLTNIPTNGKPVYITLRYQVNGAVWQTTDYTYTASQ